MAHAYVVGWVRRVVFDPQTKAALVRVGIGARWRRHDGTWARRVDMCLVELPARLRQVAHDRLPPGTRLYAEGPLQGTGEEDGDVRMSGRVVRVLSRPKGAGARKVTRSEYAWKEHEF